MPEGTRLHFAPQEQNRGSQTSSRRRRRSSATLLKINIGESQHSLWSGSFSYGLSHGLKIAQRFAIFAPVCALVTPFRVPSRAKHEIKEEIPLGISSFIWYTGRDSNPQPSEPESDALSIEPPVHLLYSLLIIARFFSFVKGKREKTGDFLSTRGPV